MDSRHARPCLWREFSSQLPRLLAVRASWKRYSRTKQSVPLRVVQTQETHGKSSPKKAMFSFPAMASGKDGRADLGFSRAAFQCPATNFIVPKGNYKNGKSLNPDRSSDCEFLRSAVPVAASRFSSFLIVAGYLGVIELLEAPAETLLLHPFQDFRKLQISCMKSFLYCRK